MIWLMLASVIMYLILLLRFNRGFVVLDKIDKTRSAERPFVSVVVAARNEELNIEECLISIVKQTYPHDKFEVILANDRSTDRTAEIAARVASLHTQVRIIDVHLDDRLKGKSNALAQAIDVSRGELVMMTDADCVVPPSWIEEIVARFMPKTGVIGSATLQFANNWWGGMQSLDWAFLHGIAAAAIAHRDPLSVIGNNLSFRRTAYEEVGGYRGIPFSVTEDFELFKAITATGKWDYRFPLVSSVLVMSHPCPDLQTLVRQKHRWAVGGLNMKLSGLLIMVGGFLLHGSLLASALTFSMYPFLFGLVVKLCADYQYLISVTGKLGKKDHLRYFFWFELYYILYVFILPFIVLLGGKVRWKGRAF